MIQSFTGGPLFTQGTNKDKVLVGVHLNSDDENSEFKGSGIFIRRYLNWIKSVTGLKDIDYSGSSDQYLCGKRNIFSKIIYLSELLL